ncbi:hypothetical protein BH23VER1_BH23VER1_25250 [soil metagenome]
MKPLSTLSRILALAAPVLLLPNASADFNTLEVWGDAVTDGGAALSGSGSGPYVLTGGGADFWGGSDQGVWAWDNTGTYTTTGDFTASVRHVSTTEPAPTWGRDILSARAVQSGNTGPAANDAHWMSYRRSNGDMGSGWRDTVGGGTSRDSDPAVGGDQPPIRTSFGSVTDTPVFLSIARDGNTMRASHAIDLDGNGNAGRYVVHHSRQIALFDTGTEVIVGIGHQAHNEGNADRVNTATFDTYAYQPSYNGTFFNAPASAGTWQVDGSIGVNSATGAVTGSAFVREGGVATGENTAWTVTAARVDTFVPTFGVAGAQKDPGAMNANDIVPASHFRINSTTPGLNADIYLAAPGGNQAANRAIIDGNAPNGTAIIPNIDWTGGSDNDANYYGLTGPASFAVAVQGMDPASDTTGAFSGNQDNYGVHITGEIFIPSDNDRVNHPFGGEWIQFEDGIDDYTFLAVDGVTLLDDNDWTNRDGTSNGGAHTALFDASDDKFNDGLWVSFEMIMWEGGGGDAGVLYWSAFDTDGTFDPLSTPGTFSDLTTLSGINQVGSDSMEGEFGLTLPAGDWVLTMENSNTLTSTERSAFVTVIPEPSVLAALSLAGLALIFRRRRW